MNFYKIKFNRNDVFDFVDIDDSGLRKSERKLRNLLLNKLKDEYK